MSSHESMEYGIPLPGKNPTSKIWLLKGDVDCWNQGFYKDGTRKREFRSNQPLYKIRPTTLSY